MAGEEKSGREISDTPMPPDGGACDTGRSLSLNRIVVIGLIALVAFILTVLSCSRRTTIPAVFGNELVPVVPVLVALSLTLLLVWLLALRPRLVVLPVVGFLMAIWYLPPWIDRIRLEDRTTSCANHVTQWIMMLRHQAKHPHQEGAVAVFPRTTDLAGISHLFVMDPMLPAYIPDSLYCPGRVDSGRASGYVFLAGGLPVEVVLDDQTLIAFCAAECHPPPVDHEHFVVGNRYECAGREDAIGWITRALEDSRTGRVAYLPEAVAVLEAELVKRKER